jgi:hypothetical protein
MKNTMNPCDEVKGPTKTPISAERIWHVKIDDVLRMVLSIQRR